MKTGVLKWVWCLGLAVGLPSCSGVEEQEVVSPDRHLVVGMTELDKGEYGDVSFSVYLKAYRRRSRYRMITGCLPENAVIA